MVSDWILLYDYNKPSILPACLASVFFFADANLNVFMFWYKLMAHKLIWFANVAFFVARYTSLMG